MFKTALILLFLALSLTRAHANSCERAAENLGQAAYETSVRALNPGEAPLDHLSKDVPVADQAWLKQSLLKVQNEIGPVIDLMGKGNFGFVFEVLQGPRRVAVKIGGSPRSLAEEQRIMRKLHDGYAASLKGTAQPNAHNPFVESSFNEKASATVMELLIPTGAHLGNFGPTHMRKVEQAGSDMLEGLVFMHSRGLVHQDVKPDNLLDSQGRVKISDLGGTRRVEDTASKFKGDFGYRSKDSFLRESGPAFSDDAYAARMTLCELLLGASPYEKRLEKFTVLKKVHYRSAAGGNIETDFRKFMRSPHTIDPNIPKELSIVAWHSWRDVDSMNVAWTKARAAVATKDNRDFLAFMKKELAKTARENPGDFVEEMRTSAELLPLWNAKELGLPNEVVARVRAADTYYNDFDPSNVMANLPAMRSWGLEMWNYKRRLKQAQ